MKDDTALHLSILVAGFLANPTVELSYEEIVSKSEQLLILIQDKLSEDLT
jgi:hypothetical protein